MEKLTFKETWEKEVPKLREYFEERHMSVSEVAEIYQIGDRTVREVCYRFGINFKQDPLLKWSDEEIDIIKTSLVNGEPFESIARKLPNKSSSKIKKFYDDYKDKFELVIGRKQLKHDDKIEKIRELVNDGYTRNEIGEILGMNPYVVLNIKLKYKIKKPSAQELQDRGIFYLTGGPKEIRYETDLTKEKLIELLDSGKSRKEIADMYGLGPRLITTLAARAGRNDKKIEAAREVKRRLILEITGKEATDKDLNKAFIDIFTKEYVEDLLKRNGYCLSRCVELELGGIDSKCLIEAIKKFEITVPEEIKDEIFLAKKYSTGYGASKIMPNSMGEYFTEKALGNLGLNFGKQLFLDNAVPKDIRPLGVSIDYTVEYSEKEYYIEYNGKPHYEFSRQYHKNDINNFISQVKRDMWVKKYCEEHDIIYVEIPYTLFTVQEIEDVLREVIINDKDINTVIDFDPIYKKIREVGITIDS